jgi:hypothetical protein
MTTRSHKSETTYGDSSDQGDNDDDLMVSFPQGPRIRKHSHDSHSHDSHSHSHSHSHSQIIPRHHDISSSSDANADADADANSGAQSAAASQASVTTCSSGDTNTNTSTGTGMSKSTSDSIHGLSVNMNSLNGTNDAKSSISCSSTSDATSARYDVTATSSKSIWSEKKNIVTIEKVSEGDSSSSSSSGTPSGSDTSSNNAEESLSEKTESQGSTSCGIPYPTASKKSLIYYGWGDIPPSESNFSQDDSQYISSQDGSIRSNRMLFAEFPDRQRCDVSLTESQATGGNGMQVEEVMVEDEYDTKRPWKKRPVDLEMDEEQRSERSFAVSALSGSDTGTVFVDVAAPGPGPVENKPHNPENTKSSMGDNLDLGEPAAQSDEGKSVKSARSSLNSEISELNVAKEALQKSSIALSNVQRQVYPRNMSMRSGSDFTLTSQPFRKPEPFRPGPETPTAAGMRHVNSSVTLNTLENIYEETGQTLGVPLPPNPPPRSRKLRALSSMSMASSSPSLPSIIENPSRGTQQEFFKQASDLTMEDTEPNNQGIMVPRARDRRISELTIPDINMDEENSFRARPTELEKQNSSNDFSISSGSLNTEDNNQTAKLFRLDEIDDEDQQESTDYAQSIGKQDIETYDSARFGFLAEDSGRSFLNDDGIGELSIAESSDDEDEQRQMTQRFSRRNSGGDSTISFTYRRYKCTHCCRRLKQRFSRCCCLYRKALTAGALATILVASSLVVMFLFVIPKGKQSDGPQGLSKGGSNSPEFISQTPTSSLSPTIAPTQVFTLWPTATDTYKQKYPPPP